MLALVSLRAGAIFGLGPELDAYFVAVSLPSLLLSLGSSVVVAVLVPRLSPLDDSIARKRAGEWALLAFLFAALLAGLIALESRFIISVLAPGLSASTADVAGSVLRIMALALPSTMAAFIYFAYGFASARVWVGGTATALYGMVWLGLLFLSPFTQSVQGTAVACVIATQIQLLVAFLCCAPPARLPWPRWRFPDRFLHALPIVAGVLIATVMTKLNLLFDPLFGSFLPRGGVSQLSYASRIAVLCIAFVGQGPALATLASGSRKIRRPSDYRLLGLRVTLLLSVGAATAVAFAFGPLAPLLLAHGALTSSSAETIGHLVQAYSVLIVVQSIAWTMESTVYASKRVWSVTLMSLPALVLNVGLSALFVWLLGAYGRPLAVTLAMMFYVCLLMRVASRTEGTSVRLYVSVLPWRDAAKLLILISAVSTTFLIAVSATTGPSSAWAVASLISAAFATLAYVRRWMRREERRLDHGAATIPLSTDPPPALA
jgi:putative peptidoglycan lipid II flippase